MTKVLGIGLLLAHGAFATSQPQPQSPSQTTPGLAHVEIAHAYEDRSGRLIIRFKPKTEGTPQDQQNPDFFGSNLTFYGTDQKLFQMNESGQTSTSNPDAFDLRFSDPGLKSPQNESGEILFQAGTQKKGLLWKTPSYTVTCGDKSRTIDYKPLSKRRIAQLQEKLRTGQVPTEPLPGVRKPKYHFKQSDGTLFYVEAPQFNDRPENYRFYMGKPGQMKDFKVKEILPASTAAGTTIKLENGSTLVFPKEGAENQQVIWNGFRPLTPLPLQSFDMSSLGSERTPAKEDVDLHTPCDKFVQGRTGIPETRSSDPGFLYPPESAMPPAF